MLVLSLVSIKALSFGVKKLYTNLISGSITSGIDTENKPFDGKDLPKPYSPK